MRYFRWRSEFWEWSLLFEKNIRNPKPNWLPNPDDCTNKTDCQKETEPKTEFDCQEEPALKDNNWLWCNRSWYRNESRWRRFVAGINKPLKMCRDEKAQLVGLVQKKKLIWNSQTLPHWYPFPEFFTELLKISCFTVPLKVRYMKPRKI